MKNALCVLLAFTFFFAGCCGREGNPVQAYLPGDEKRSCESVCAEMSQAQTEIARLTPKANKAGYNTVMFVGGLFVIVPFFFMDFKNGEKVELQAYRQRYNSLSLIAAQKGCVIADGGAKRDVPVAVPASN
ncbi:MAG: hypothetical protein A2Y07_00650 [Planctomycetes bacterium GWF2_50_10]|nr:MAG: hypothetical protein A2Y07_00650 [Planctomycetes bacterium GWF2_50_10]